MVTGTPGGNLRKEQEKKLMSTYSLKYKHSIHQAKNWSRVRKDRLLFSYLRLTDTLLKKGTENIFK